MNGGGTAIPVVRSAAENQIAAALPVLTNILSGDLPVETGVPWVMHILSPELGAEPTARFVEGLGPPLDQIEQDYRELEEEATAGSPYAASHRQCAKDVLALVAEIRRLDLGGAR